MRNDNSKAFPPHTSDRKKLDRAFVLLGGRIEPINGTGEVRYYHPNRSSTLRLNVRRKDAAKKLNTWVNFLRKFAALEAANDPVYWPSRKRCRSECGRRMSSKPR